MCPLPCSADRPPRVALETMNAPGISLPAPRARHEYASSLPEPGSAHLGRGGERMVVCGAYRPITAWICSTGKSSITPEVPNVRSRPCCPPSDHVAVHLSLTTMS